MYMLLSRGSTSGFGKREVGQSAGATCCDALGPGGSESGQSKSGGEGVYSLLMHSRSLDTIDPSHAYNAGTEHLGFSPTRQTSRAQEREPPCESHEGQAAHPTKSYQVLVKGAPSRASCAHFFCVSG